MMFVFFSVYLLGKVNQYSYFDGKIMELDLGNDSMMDFCFLVEKNELHLLNQEMELSEANEIIDDFKNLLTEGVI